MSKLIHENFKNNKSINWMHVYKLLFKIQNRIVYQIERKKFRNARNLQRLLLKSVAPKLIASQKIFEIEDYKNFILYKSHQKKIFAKILDINNYIQFEINLKFQSNRIYFYFLKLLWLFALLPLHETYSESLCYNFRLYRDYTDVLKDTISYLKSLKLKWILILKPTGFLNIENKKWLINNLLIEKKFLLDFFSYNQVEKYFVNEYNYSQELSETKKISLKKIVKNYSLQGCKLFKKTSNRSKRKKKNLIKLSFSKFSYPSIIYYNNLLLIPVTTPTQLIFLYKYIFKFLKTRGLSIKKNRIWITNLNNGFPFLGWFLKKDNENISIEISSQNIRSHKLEIRKFLKFARFLSIDKTISLLNKKIYNWQMYYSYASNLNKTWSEMNYYLFWRIWKWCKKKHKNKGSKWIYQRYWSRIGKKWVFHFNNQYLKSYNFKKQKIIYLSGSINACKIKNLEKIQQIIYQKRNSLR